MQGWFISTLMEHAVDTQDSVNCSAAAILDSVRRHDDAWKICEALRKHIFPKDHPDIARAMNDLALSHTKLGTCDDAWKIREEVLESWARITNILQKATKPGEERKTVAIFADYDGCFDMISPSNPAGAKMDKMFDYAGQIGRLRHPRKYAQKLLEDFLTEITADADTLSCSRDQIASLRKQMNSTQFKMTMVWQRWASRS